DENYKVENLLSGPGSKPWLCDSYDKSGRLEAVFQLEKASYIDFIDIGNHGSSTIEIQVGRSSFAGPSGFVSYLPAVTLLSLTDLKVGVDHNAVYMFDKKNMNEAACSKKWDQIKIICCQPYKKQSQFGLSFFSLRTNETSSQLYINDQLTFNNRNESVIKTYFDVLGLFSKVPPGNESRSDFTFTRGKQLLKASQSRISNETSIKPFGFNNNKSILQSKFEEDVNIFLIACVGDEENKSLEDYLQEFESQRQEKLNCSQKLAFSNKYLEIFHHNPLTSDFNQESPTAINQNSLSLSSNSGSHSEESKSPSSNRLKEINNLSSRHSTDVICLDNELPSFDIKLCTPNKVVFKRKSSERNGSEESRRNHKRFKSPFQNAKVTELLNVRPEDFIQPDGEQPSTSHGFSFIVDCPICGKTFLPPEIERHASKCGDTEPEVQFLGVTKASAEISKNNDSYECCPICEELFSPDAISEHVDKCLDKADRLEGNYERQTAREVML
ncbi:DNA repair protein XRCC1, partial [Caerostris extrusa]